MPKKLSASDKHYEKIILKLRKERNEYTIEQENIINSNNYLLATNEILKKANKKLLIQVNELSKYLNMTDDEIKSSIKKNDSINAIATIANIIYPQSKGEQ